MTPTPPDTTVVSRLVVRAPNWLGDAVLALPAMAGLRAHFRGAHLTIAAPAGFADVFAQQIDASPDAVLPLPKSPKAIRAALEAGKYDLGVLFPNSFRSALLLKQARIPERWGYARAARGWLLTRRPRPAAVHGVQHQADYYRELVRRFGIPVPDDLPRITASATALARAEALLLRAKIVEGRRLVVLAPGAAYGQAKQWPPHRVAAVAQRLVRDRDVVCVMVGAGHDRDAARAVDEWMQAHAPAERTRVIDLTGQTSLVELIGVLARADAVLANDSGAMHLAAALGRRVVAVFGPTDERATRPLGPHDVLTASAFCRPCHMRDCPIDHRCMTRVTADQVFAALSRQLAFAPATR